MNPSPYPRRTTTHFYSDRPPKRPAYRSKMSRGAFCKAINANEVERLKRREDRLIREENQLVADSISYHRGERFLADLADAIAEFLNPEAKRPTILVDTSNEQNNTIAGHANDCQQH
jgi:hypothetical protein